MNVEDKNMNVLIADKFSKLAQDELIKLGFRVTYKPEVILNTLADAIRQHSTDILIVRSTRVTELALSVDSLKLVIRAGSGFNNIDINTAKDKSVFVCNCPGKNANAVTELAFGLIIALDRYIPQNVSDLKIGLWNKAEYSNGYGLYGRTLGLIGLGTIGASMIPRAKAFGMKVVGWSRGLSPERAIDLGIQMKSDPMEVASSSDIVSLHVALNQDTRSLVDSKFLFAMRYGSYLINTSRAEVIDETALADAVKNRGLKIGIDVFNNEPALGNGKIHNSLFELDGVIGTHHIGGQTVEAQLSIANETVRIITEYRLKGVPPNLVY